MQFNNYRPAVMLVSALSLLACGPSRSSPDAGKGNNGPDAGCTSNCDDGGTPPVVVPDGGNPDPDGGTTVRELTLAQAKKATFCTDRIRVKGLVVVAVDSISKPGTNGDFSTQFWVADPANPTEGIYVDRFHADVPTTYKPQAGDVIDVEGYLGTESKFNDRNGHRFTLKSQFGCKPVGTGTLVITPQSPTAPLSDNAAPSGFGNAVNGTVKANPELAGTRVHIPGPLTLTNPSPAAFKRVSLYTDDTVYFGFEVTGGILVNNYRTFGTSPTDGGAPRCDWRAVANDGGSVTFDNGISGVWDSYTHAPCTDGGTASGCRRNEGFVPGADAGYTFVLYPQDCANDLAGH